MLRIEMTRDANGVCMVRSPDVTGYLVFNRDPAAALTSFWKGLSDLAANDQYGLVYHTEHMATIALRSLGIDVAPKGEREDA